MPQTSSRDIDESALTKGHLRKLNALRKSVGEDIGERGVRRVALPASNRKGERPERRVDRRKSLVPC